MKFYCRASDTPRKISSAHSTLYSSSGGAYSTRMSSRQCRLSEETLPIESVLMVLS